MKAYIRATGRYLPSKILSNKDLESIVDTSDEWITTRTGIKERRIAAEDEQTSDMGHSAAVEALQKANLKAEEIDLILVATLTPDHIFPSVACIIQDKLGASNAFAMDFQAACSGYLYGLNMAKSYIESGMAKNVLLIASEKLSSIVDYEDRTTCVLFGDGAAAAVISHQGPGLAITKTDMGCDGSQSHLITQPAGGSKHPSSEQTIKDRLHYIQMEGNAVFKHAVRRMLESCKKCLDIAGLTEKDVDWMVTHQANDRIIEAIAKRFDVEDHKVFKTIHKYGNTSASSVGIALDELLEEKQINQGEHILLTAFGSGLTWGSCVLKQEESEV